MGRTALVLGCGGTIGGAWIIAALRALAEQTGWDPARADILQGTSAGAEIVTMLAGGYRVADLVEMHAGRSSDPVLSAHLAATPSGVPPVPRPGRLTPSTLWRRRGGHEPLVGIAPRGRGDASWLDRLAHAVVPEDDSWLPHSGARLVAYRVDDGARVAFGAPGAPPVPAAVGLRASWAVPGWMPPVTVAGATYVDGGAASTASVDLIGPDEADLVYLVAPMASDAGVRAPGLGGLIERVALRDPMSRVFWREVDEVRSRGTKIVVITPSSADMAGLGANFMNRAGREHAFNAALASVDRTVAQALAAQEVSQ